MQPAKVHFPGKPKRPEPPQALLDFIDQYSPPQPVVRWGLTVTTDGQWAMLVSVPGDTEVPLTKVEQSAPGIHIVYEAEPDEPIAPQA